MEMPKGVRLSRPSGGLFVWVELPPHLDARELLRRALERQVAFVPGGGFFPRGNKENTMRLSFSSMPVGRITEGIRRLSGAVKEMLGTDASRERQAAANGAGKA
jgi:2-aminoadipate transaminase